MTFSNDLLGRGGSSDDFRTSQLILAGRLSERWMMLLDHSILTLRNAPEPGRVDTLAGSLGYELLSHRGTENVSRLVVGGGFRSAGDFGGESIQNGFHRVVPGNTVQTMPYVDTSRADLTVWLDAERYRLLQRREDSSWQYGYWIRGNTLATSDGQWDGAAGAYGVATRNSLGIWFGLRRDWRTGYDRDRVQIATAKAEDDFAVVLGMRFGALIVETVQQLNNSASYGQVRFISTGRTTHAGNLNSPRLSMQMGFSIPDVLFELSGKHRSALLTPSNAAWQESVFVDVRFGEPQYRDNSSIFTRTEQLAAGLEWERPLGVKLPWISLYSALGLGWRMEELTGDGAFRDEPSEPVGRGVMTLAAGLRFNAANLGRRWRYRVQIGATGVLPFRASDVMFAGQSLAVQEPQLGLVLGMSFDRD